LEAASKAGPKETRAEPVKHNELSTEIGRELQGQCSTLRSKFGGENRWVFRPRVSQRADDCGSFKAGSPEFIEECTCILCASDSRKPIGSAELEMLGQRCSEDQLRT